MRRNALDFLALATILSKGRVRVAKSECRNPKHQLAADASLLQQQVKQAGEQWDLQRKAWNLSYERVVALGPQERVIGRWEGLNREWHPSA